MKPIYEKGWAIWLKILVVLPTLTFKAMVDKKLGGLNHETSFKEAVK
jgi:hypothetical protein